MYIRSGFSGISAKLRKKSLSGNVEEFFEEFLDPHPDADAFRNLIGSS